MTRLGFAQACCFEGGLAVGRQTKMNSITSPQLLEQVNPQNIQLLQDFLDYLRSVQRSEGTIASYQNDISIAFVWNLQYNDNKFFVEWTKRNIIAYQNWLLTTNQNSPARIRRLKAALSSMSNFIESVLDDEFPNFRNIITKVESPVNQAVREKTVLTEKEVDDLLSILVSNKKYEMACYVALAAFGGRRKAEICRFKVSDFGDDKLVCGGSLWKSDPIKTKGRSLGKYLNCYTLVKKFKPYLDLWMDERERNHINSEWLFPSLSNPAECLQISTVNSWMESISKHTGKNYYAHAFRHFYTTMLSNQGLPDNVIKEIIGWQDISMVSVYVDRSTEDTLDMYFDADGIKKKKPTDINEL
jgi:integrase